MALIWTLWERDDGQLVLVNGHDPRSKEPLVVPRSEAPHIAAALALHCTDNDERGFVRDAWGDIDEGDDGR